MHKRTCTTPGCDKPHRAKGLCATHYNKRNPNKYRMVTVQCGYCGKDCDKEAGRANKYANLYCSAQCRDWDRYGACKLPANHWARWYGRTCKIPLSRVRRDEVIPCAWCGEHYHATRAASKYCKETCSRKAGKARRRAREASAPGEFAWSEVMRIHLMAERRCSYCDTVTDQPDPDHVVPLSRGGRNDIGNILPCCKQCNGDKGDMTLAEWAEYRARRGKAQVRVEFNRSEARFRHLIEGVATGSSHRLKIEFERAA